MAMIMPITTNTMMAIWVQIQKGDTEADSLEPAQAWARSWV